jgi:hypothetical protein
VTVNAGMLVAMISRQSSNDLDSSVLHTAHSEDPIRHDLKLVRTAAHHNDLKAKIVAEVYVQRRADALAELVL